MLKPGRKAVITAWLADERATEVQQRRLLEPICREGRLPGMGTRTDYAALIQAAGLRLERFEDLSQRVMKTWQICQRRVLRTLLTSPSMWWFLIRRKSSHAIFLLTVRRIQRAYLTGAMRYGIFVLESPSEP